MDIRGSFNISSGDPPLGIILVGAIFLIVFGSVLSGLPVFSGVGSVVFVLGIILLIVGIVSFFGGESGTVRF